MNDYCRVHGFETLVCITDTSYFVLVCRFASSCCVCVCVFPLNVLGSNSLTGTIPESIGFLVAMEHFDLRK